MMECLGFCSISPQNQQHLHSDSTLHQLSYRENGDSCPAPMESVLICSVCVGHTPCHTCRSILAPHNGGNTYSNHRECTAGRPFADRPRSHHQHIPVQPWVRHRAPLSSLLISLHLHSRPRGGLESTVHSWKEPAAQSCQPTAATRPYRPLPCEVCCCTNMAQIAHYLMGELSKIHGQRSVSEKDRQTKV